MNSHKVNLSRQLKRLNSAEYLVLAVLNLAPAHGYSAWRYLTDHLGGVWRLGRSQIYALLSHLEHDRLVSHERVDQQVRPARKVFRLTAQGQRVVDAWIRSPVHRVRNLRLDFPAKLHFAQTVSAEVASQLIRDQVAVCLEKREQVQAAIALCKSDIERHVLEYRVSVIDATVKWLEKLAPGEWTQELRMGMNRLELSTARKPEGTLSRRSEQSFQHLAGSVSSDTE